MNRWLVFAALLTVLAGVGVLTQMSIAPVPAQMSQPKITGRVVDKVVKSFDAAGLPGIHSIEYRRFTMSPGAKVEGEFAFDGDQLERAEVAKPSDNGLPHRPEARPAEEEEL